jgi:putative DNA primase/helicase
MSSSLLTLDEAIDRLEFLGMQVRGQYSQCPCHDDRTASMSITEKDGRVLVHCHAGCRWEDIFATLRGSKTVGYRPDSGERLATVKARKAMIIEDDGAPYCYTSLDGTRLRKQRVREVNPDNPNDVKRSFRWSWDTTGKGSWSPGDGGHKPMLYRPAVNTGVVVDSGWPLLGVEGESDADALAQRGYRAVSPAHGAVSGKLIWPTEWTEELHDEPTIIWLADNEAPPKPGRRRRAGR